MKIDYKRNGNFTVILESDEIVFNENDAVEIDADLNDFNWSDIEDYVESQGYTIVENGEYDELLDRIDIHDTQELIEEIESQGYTVRRSNDRIDELLEYIDKYKLNNIQIDELLDKILL